MATFLSYKLAVVGSSHLVDSEPVYDVLDTHILLNGKPEIVVTGNSKTGVDLMTKKWCKRNNIKVVQYAVKEDNKIGHQDRNRDLLHASTVLIAFPLHRRSKYIHQLIQTARSSEFHPTTIKAVFVHTQYLSKEDKKAAKNKKKRARSCSPIREVDEKKRQSKFAGSYITPRRPSPLTIPTTTESDNEPDHQQQQYQ